VTLVLYLPQIIFVPAYYNPKAAQEEENMMKTVIMVEAVAFFSQIYVPECNSGEIIWVTLSSSDCNS